MCKIWLYGSIRRYKPKSCGSICSYKPKLWRGVSMLNSKMA
jgi:hypothetical protein